MTDFPCAYNPVIQANAGITVENATAAEVALAIEKIAALNAGEYVKYCSNALKAADIYDFKNLTQKLTNVISK